MKRRRTIGIIVSLFLIAAILLVFTDPWSLLRRDAERIRLPDAGKIDRIILSDRYDTVFLVKEDSTWLINGEEEAEPVAVENLLFAAERLQVVSIHPESAGRKSGTVRSVLFLQGGREILGYELVTGGNQLLVRPSGNGQLFSVTLPGYAGLDLDRVFSGVANHYRKHMLIDLLPSEISCIEVRRKDEPPFRFTMDGEGNIRCTLPETDSTISPDMLDELSIRLLFSYFTSIRVEERVGSASAAMEAGMDQERWLASLYVESRQGEKHTMQLFSLPGEGGEGTHMFRAVVIHNDDPEALVVNYIYLDVLIRGLSRYFARGG